MCIAKQILTLVHTFRASTIIVTFPLTLTNKHRLLRLQHHQPLFSTFSTGRKLLRLT